MPKITDWWHDLFTRRNTLRRSLIHAMLRSVAGLEVAVISLGAAMVKSAAKMWLGDRQFANDMTPAGLTDGSTYGQ